MQLCGSFSWLIFICLAPIFQGVKIDKLLNGSKEFIFLTVVALEMEKKDTISVVVAADDKILHQKHESFTCELALIKLSWLDKYKVKKILETRNLNDFWTTTMSY